MNFHELEKKERHWHKTNPLGQISNCSINMSRTEAFLKVVF